MELVSTRLIVKDIKKVVNFYELITGYQAEWLAPVFAEIITPVAVVAIGSEETVALFKENCARPASNQSAILEFMVKDVDEEFIRLKEYGLEFVHEPKNMPWGNRTMQIRDPEGTLVSFFTPVTDAAINRFKR
ncbi:VOC family protein [Enterobacter cancerogenus]|uniref:VOC family protein n=1 Tax=Enterobacter cancerogenus TaxID=69218 RepID=UPI00053910E8|nr:VOC family protein [Enterobacter cancerogenus]KGT92168.1 glyoxalase [Enterobacter cancerogenus]